MTDTEQTATIPEEVPVTEKKAKKPRKTKKPAKAKKTKKVAKARAAKPKAKKASKGTQGQNGEAIELKLAKMNDDEKKLVTETFSPKGEREAFDIKTLQGLLTPGKTKNTSRARNALRRLVRGGWFEQAERGKYRWTEKGRKRGIKED